MSLRSSPIRGLQVAYSKEIAIENYALITENERLAHLIVAKNQEIQSYAQANSRMKNSYQAQALAYRKTIEALEKQLNQSEKSRQAEFKEIRQKFDKLTKEQMSSLKLTHTNELEFLFKEIAQLRASVEAYKSKLEVKDHEADTIKQSYERQIALNVSQISSLNKMILQLEENKGKQIKDLTNKRDLQKSRTSGLVSSRKQTSQYMQKQFRKLNEQVLEKTIYIENVQRQLNKQKKKHEETAKTMNKKIDIMKEDYENQLKQKEEYFGKIQKLLKDEILQYKEKQIRLLNENQTFRSNINTLKKQIQSKAQIIKNKTEEVTSIKSIIEKMREDHITEINNLMKERRKRSSKSNLGSSRSLGSSLKESTVLEAPKNENDNLSSKIANFLPIVKEESPDRKDLSQQLNQSQVQQQEENQLARAVFHYDSVIEQLKRSHDMQLQYYRLNEQKISRKLIMKENQLEDVLTRFSPLVKIHADEKSLEEDRKQRIEKHWKADLAILEIMLNKYKIQTF